MEHIANFQNFTKKYGNFTAVDNINLQVETGTITGFVGKNGAGKSTTIRAMMNILFPTIGDITIAELDSVKDAKAIKALVSYMPSDAALYESITPRALFVLCAKLGEGTLEDATALATYFELDLDKKIATLSLGNRKKVCIIQALLKNSSLFILDEPTNGLDPLMQEKFFKKLLERKEQGATIFLSSHNLLEIEKYCDYAVIIKDGKIVDSIDMKQALASRKQLVSCTTADGVTRNFAYDGNPNTLIAKLAQLNLTHIEIRQASIEETFIHFYEEDQTR